MDAHKTLQRLKWQEEQKKLKIIEKHMQMSHALEKKKTAKEQLAQLQAMSN